jgi:hypothetical protein
MASEQGGDEEEDDKAWLGHCEQKELFVRCSSGLKVIQRLKLSWQALDRRPAGLAV